VRFVAVVRSFKHHDRRQVRRVPLDVVLLLKGHFDRLFVTTPSFFSVSHNKADMISRYIGLALAMTSALAIGMLSLEHDQARPHC